MENFDDHTIGRPDSRRSTSAISDGPASNPLLKVQPDVIVRAEIITEPFDLTVLGNVERCGNHSRSRTDIHNPVGQMAAQHPGLVKIGRLGSPREWSHAGWNPGAAGGRKGFGFAKDPATATEEASPIGAIKTVAGSGGAPCCSGSCTIGMLLYGVASGVPLLPGSTDAKGWRTASATWPAQRVHHVCATAPRWRDATKVPTATRRSPTSPRRS